MSLIHERMIAVMRGLTHVSKDQRNPQQGFSFRGIDDVLNAVGPVLREHGVFLIPTVQDVSSESVSTKSGGTAFRTIVTVAYLFVADDGTSVTAMGRGEAIDHGDKSVSKAMSMALKYVLFQAFALPTDEPDPDSEVHEVSHRPEPSADEGDIDQIRQSLLDWAYNNGVSPPTLASQFNDAYGHPLTQATLAELTEFHAKLQLGGQEVPSNGDG